MNLPLEVTWEVLKYLSPQELKKLATLSHYWYESVYSNQTFQFLMNSRFNTVEYNHQNAVEEYKKRHLMSIHCSSDRMCIAWGNDSRYWTKTPDMGCDCGFYYSLRFVFWLDVSASFPCVLQGTFIPTMRIKVDSIGTLSQVKLIVSCEDEFYCNEVFLNQVCNQYGKWIIIELDKITLRSDGPTVKMQLKDTAGTLKHGLDLDYFSLIREKRNNSIKESTVEQESNDGENANLIGSVFNFMNKLFSK
jgi:hypothetical protein